MMRDSPAWQSSNDQYLTDAIDWIRTRLERLAADDQALRAGQGGAVRTAATATATIAPPTTAPHPGAHQILAAPPMGSPSRWLLERLRGLTVAESTARSGDAAGVPAAPSAAPGFAPANAAPGASSPAGARAACQAPAWNASQPPALIELGRRLGLSGFEREVVLLALAAQLDAGVAALCARVQRTPARQVPTLALALALFDHPTWDAMAPGRPLRCWQLLVTDEAGEPHSLAASALRPDPRIVGYVKGHNYLDQRIATLVAPLGAALLAPLSTPGAGLPPLHARVATGIERALSAADGTELPVCQLSGGDSTSKRMVAQHVAQARQLTLYFLPASALPHSLVQVDLLAGLWRRESLLLPLALYIESAPGGGACPAPVGVGPQHAALRRFLQRCGGLVMVDSAEEWHDMGRLTLPWELAPITASAPAAAAQPPASEPHAA